MALSLPVNTCVFVVQVNGTDVVKVGHRQVVSLIRQGGSRLLMKVVSVSRKSESNLLRKKGAVSLCLIHLVTFHMFLSVWNQAHQTQHCFLPAAPPPPKRAPSTSLTLRSKSMTADLEEIGKKTHRHRHTQHSKTVGVCVDLCSVCSQEETLR